MTGPEILVHRTADVLAASAAARLVTTLVDLQASKGSASVVLTGGGVGIALLEQLRRSPAREAVDWSRLDLYWGDERFVPAGDAERNELQARETLLNHVPVDPARVHPMAASDGEFGNKPDAAADAYARLLAEDASGRGDVPTFDIALLGMGPEGHVASVFPESPAVYETDASVVAVRNCPKPPPTRVSLTLPTIRRASEVWLLAAGEGKSDALALALSGAGEIQLPVAGATGRGRTLWLLDESAAAKLDHR